MKIKRLLLVLIIPICIQAEDLGAIGKTYPIGEQSLLEYIKQKASSMVADGSWEKLRQQAVARTEQQIDHPPAIAGIGPTIESNVRYYDPSIRINQDIVDPYTKKMLAKKGQIINPTTYLPFNNELIFIDGRDPEQISYALTESKRSTFRTSIVLTATNNFRALLKQEHQLFFYDQGATLTKKFGIRHVPTIIYQDNMQPTKLRIEEVKI